MYLLSRLGPAGRLPVFYGLAYVTGFILMYLMVRNCPSAWSEKRILLLVIGVGVVGRLFFLGFPVSNDVYRYIWEGYIQNHGFNPYLHAPADPLFTTLREGNLQTIWESINHKDLSAAYPPLVMLIFRALAVISPTSLFFQSVMLIFDLVTMIILLLFVRRLHLPISRLLFYTANPFILVYVVGEAHLDIIQTAFLVGGLYCVHQKMHRRGFLLLGAAVFSKYLAIVALPFVLQRANLRHVWYAAFSLIAMVPFAADPGALFHSLGIFGTTMHYNDSLAEVVRFFAGGYSVPLLIGMLTLILLLIFLVEHQTMRSVYLATGALLIFLPTLHPWYLLLIAPFLVIYPSRSWFYLLAATIVTLPVMAIEYQTGVFQEIKLLKLIEYLPFYGLLIYDFFQRRPYSPGSPTRYPQVASVSVVVPTLNEDEHLTQALSALPQDAAVREVIVADGGSGDNTREIARRVGALVSNSRPGRGYQIAKGVEQASGDVILVLHADTVLAPGAIAGMLEHLNAHPTMAGGAFGMTFSSNATKLKIISFLNNFRAKWLGISFGDQAQFFRREAHDHLGGFPAMMLMEDVELSMRLKKIGRPLFIPHGVKVSARGWAKKGFSGNAFLVISLFVRYLLERRLYGETQVAQWYYQRYYGGENSS